LSRAEKEEEVRRWWSACCLSPRRSPVEFLTPRAHAHLRACVPDAPADLDACLRDAHAHLRACVRDAHAHLDVCRRHAHAHLRACVRHAHAHLRACVRDAHARPSVAPVAVRLPPCSAENRTRSSTPNRPTNLNLRPSNSTTAPYQPRTRHKPLRPPTAVNPHH